jgi:phage RecT family recombinase
LNAWRFEPLLTKLGGEMSDILAHSLFKDSKLFSRLQGNIQAVLGPSGLSATRFVVMAQRTVTHNPRLLQCTALSVAASIVEAAIWGLEVGGQAGQAYLVPFNNNIEGADGKRHKVMECQLQVGYKGFEAVAWREAKILMPSACVYSGDKFHVTLGSNPCITHEPKLSGNHSQLIAAYARAVFPDGRELIAVHDVAEIERRRKCSKGANGDAWTRFYDAMARKGPIRQLGATQIPYSFAPRLQEMATADEYREAGTSTYLPEAEERAKEITDASTVVNVEEMPQGAAEVPPDSVDGTSSVEGEVNTDGAAPPPGDWAPKQPGDNCEVTYATFTEIEQRRAGKTAVNWLKDANGDTYSTFDMSLAKSVPINTPLVIAFQRNTKGDKTYLNLVAVKAATKNHE